MLTSSKRDQRVLNTSTSNYLGISQLSQIASLLITGINAICGRYVNEPVQTITHSASLTIAYLVLRR